MNHYHKRKPQPQTPRYGMSEARARELAKGDRHYVARQTCDGSWFVWDCVSDHRVEFQDIDKWSSAMGIQKR